MLGSTPTRYAPFIDVLTNAADPDDRERVASEHATVGETRQGSFSGFLIVRPTGDVRRLQTRTKVVRDLDGRDVIVGAAIDLTDADPAGHASG